MLTRRRPGSSVAASLRSLTVTDSLYDHFMRSDVVAEYDSFDFLLAPEATILEELRRVDVDAISAEEAKGLLRRLRDLARC